MREETFFNHVRKSPKSFLIIDYDGTLAPFTVEREKAVPDERLMQLLENLQKSGRCRVTIVSGRCLKDLIPLLKISPLPPLWGSHGLERQDENGHKSTYRLSEEEAALLKTENEALEKLFGKDVEIKPFSLALHWRGQSEKEGRRREESAKTRWQPLTEQGKFEIHYFSCGIELRLREANKGNVIHSLLTEIADMPCAYIGDDLTDEDAFIALGERGFKVLLRHHSKKSHADLEIEDRKELLHLLTSWLEIYDE